MPNVVVGRHDYFFHGFRLYPDAFLLGNLLYPHQNVSNYWSLNFEVVAGVYELGDLSRASVVGYADYGVLGVFDDPNQSGNASSVAMPSRDAVHFVHDNDGLPHLCPLLEVVQSLGLAQVLDQAFDYRLRPVVRGVDELSLVAQRLGQQFHHRRFSDAGGARDQAGARVSVDHVGVYLSVVALFLEARVLLNGVSLSSDVFDLVPLSQPLNKLPLHVLVADQIGGHLGLVLFCPHEVLGFLRVAVDPSGQVHFFQGAAHGKVLDLVSEDVLGIGEPLPEQLLEVLLVQDRNAEGLGLLKLLALLHLASVLKHIARHQVVAPLGYSCDQGAPVLQDKLLHVLPPHLPEHARHRELQTQQRAIYFFAHVILHVHLEYLLWRDFLFWGRKSRE